MFFGERRTLMYSRCVFLNEIGLSHLMLRDDGLIYNTETGEYSTAQINGNVERYSYELECRIRMPISHLLNHYFEAPWARHIVPIYRWLTDFGYSKYCITTNAEVYSTYTNRYLVGNKSVDGYSKVLLTSDDGPSNSMILHRLVAMVFIPNPENKPEVNHLDGNKDNNCVDNLEWVFPYENMEHALNTGLRKRALSDEILHKICEMLEAGVIPSDIMTQCGVLKHHVLGIKSGCHARISKHYNIPKNKHFSGNPNWAVCQ